MTTFASRRAGYKRPPVAGGVRARRGAGLRYIVGRGLRASGVVQASSLHPGVVQGGSLHHIQGTTFKASDAGWKPAPHSRHHTQGT
ncbi:MAG: hypothetical protein AB7S36_14050, partial [Planctomycetota bacterium]